MTLDFCSVVVGLVVPALVFEALGGFVVQLVVEDLKILACLPFLQQLLHLTTWHSMTQQYFVAAAVFH